MFSSRMNQSNNNHRAIHGYNAKSENNGAAEYNTTNSIHNYLFGNPNNNPQAMQHFMQQELHQQNQKMSTASSFDVVRSDSFSSIFSAVTSSPNPPFPPNPFTAHFEAINRLPVDYWLKGKNNKAKEEYFVGSGGGNPIGNRRPPTPYDEEDEEEVEPNDSMVDGLATMLSNLETILPQLEQADEQLKRMMRDMKRMLANNGNGQKRIHPQQKTPPPHSQQFTFQPPKLTTTLEENEGNDWDMEKETAGAKKCAEKFPSISLKLPADPAHWLKKYPPPKANRPMNEMAEDLSCWESVLGWKSILEKIHASGEHVWLAPSSRTIKN